MKKPKFINSVTSTAGMKNRIKKMRSAIFDQMLRTRGAKYRSFLRYLRLYRHAAFAPVRGEFLESYYTLMRYLDDVVDGDMPLPEGYANGTAYLSEKIEFSKNPVITGDDADNLMKYSFELAKKFGEDFSAETSDILNSLLFDAGRRGKGIIFPEQELYHHFHMLDIRGTIRATLKIFREDPEKYTVLEPLGLACRHQYTIEDIASDLKAGYVNIPREEIDIFGIAKEDLVNASAPAIQKWIQHHAEQGMKLLSKHRMFLPLGRFSLFTRLVLRIVYERPARKVFRKVLAGP